MKRGCDGVYVKLARIAELAPSHGTLLRLGRRLVRSQLGQLVTCRDAPQPMDLLHACMQGCIYARLVGHAGHTGSTGCDYHVAWCVTQHNNAHAPTPPPTRQDYSPDMAWPLLRVLCGDGGRAANRDVLAYAHPEVPLGPLAAAASGWNIAASYGALVKSAPPPPQRQGQQQQDDFFWRLRMDFKGCELGEPSGTLNEQQLHATAEQVGLVHDL